MVDIRCYKCGGKSSGDTLEDARSKLNHAVGKSRGIKCGDNYNCIEEVKDTVVDTTVPESSTQEADAPIPETPKDNDQNDSPIDTVEEKPSKLSKKKSKFSY